MCCRCNGRVGNGSQVVSSSCVAIWSAHLGIILREGSRICNECFDPRSGLPLKSVSAVGRKTRGSRQSLAEVKGYHLRQSESSSASPASALRPEQLADNVRVAEPEEVHTCLRECFTQLKTLRRENASLSAKTPKSLMSSFQKCHWESVYGVLPRLIDRLSPRLRAAAGSSWSHKTTLYNATLVFFLWTKKGAPFHTCAVYLEVSVETCRRILEDVLDLMTSIAAQEIKPVPRSELQRHSKPAAAGGLVVAVGDCVDIFVQAPGDREVKHAVYDGVHKKRYAVKFFTLVHPSGRIICVEGPYRPAGKAEDFLIFDELMAREEGLRSWFQPSDVLLLDRGFERALSMTDKTLFPGTIRVPIHSKDGTWADNEADTSRLCTSHRWIVEQVNSHIKTFKILHSEHFPVVLLPRLRALVLCAAYVRNELLSLSSYATTFVEQDFPQKQAKKSRKGALADEISCALVQSPDAAAPPNDRYHLAKRRLVEMMSRSRLLALILAWVPRAFHPRSDAACSGRRSQA